MSRRAAFAWVGPPGLTPLVACSLLSGSLFATLTTLALHRPELEIDLALSGDGVLYAAGVGAAVGLVGVLVAVQASTAGAVALLLQGAAGIAGISMLVSANVRDDTWLRVLVGLALFAFGAVSTLMRTHALDVYGAGGGWRVLAAVWCGAALGTAAIGAVHLVADRPNWGFELAGAGTVAVLGAMQLTPNVTAPEVGGRHAPRGEAPRLMLVALTATVSFAVATFGVVGYDRLVDRWEVSRANVGGLVLLTGVAAAGTALFGHWYHRLARRSLTHLCGASGAVAVSVAVLAVVGGGSKTLVGLVGCTVALGAAAILGVVSVDDAGTQGLPPAQRTGVFATLSASALVGTAGIALVPVLRDQMSDPWVLCVTVLPAAMVGIMAMAGFGEDTPHEHHRMVDLASEVTTARRGGHEPLLDVAALRAGYDGIEVLDGVDLHVDPGELVSLIGTNGAGKTTLLRTISGLLSPTAGVVRFGGVDLADLDAPSRVVLGISQIAGGSAVAPGLTVAENLRMFAHTLPSAHGGADVNGRAFEVFPRLAERRGQLASTLSGGEQQMLALSKALILRPQLLIIDEFSLGLAPKLVGELLPVVTEINDGGTAVLLVEQSVNIALSVSSRAYVMEKGRIVHEGSSDELAGDPDLLASVYLEGVASAMAT